MQTKSVPFEYKSLDEAGTFEATVAVFNNVDKIGDRIMPGAFVKSLAQWEASGDPIPVIFNHDWASAHAHIGVVEKAMETSQGLLVKGRLDVADNDVARQVHRLMQRRSLREFSFGYSIPKGGEKKAKDGANELLEIDIAEVGPTLKGMNPATELHAVKSALEGAAEPSREDLIKELEEVKGRLSKALADLEKKAEEADKEPTKARSVDPLRRQADEVALRYASGGLSLEKPPSPVAPKPRPTLVDLDELRQRMRDDMLIHLNGDIE